MRNKIITVIFCIILASGMFASVFVPDKYYSESEKRTLKQLPKITAEDLASGKFGKEIEEYLADQFPARDGWVSAKTICERIFGKTESGGVYFGKDGYLIEAHKTLPSKQAKTNFAALKKLSVAASSAQYVQLLQDVRRLSGEATANLGNLPASHVDTMALNRFVIQAGDYANTLSVRILNGGMPGADDREQLDALYEASVRVAAALEDRLGEEAFPTETVTSETYFESALAAEGESGGTQEANLSNYPTLIYDGPFSDSTEKAEPLGLPEETVDAETALARASESLGGASLTPDGETLGSIETYDFSGTDAAGRSVEISITKRGGCVLTMMKTPEGGVALAVRRSDGSIVREFRHMRTKAVKGSFYGLPIVRGVVSFVESLVGGMRITTRSAEIYGDGVDEEPDKFERWLSEKLGKSAMDVTIGVAVVLAAVLAVGLFRWKAISILPSA